MSDYVVTTGRPAVRRLTNRVMMWLVRRGLPVRGAQVLTVRGRRSGAPRQAPVYPLRHEGHTYLVAPRGHVQWTHNMRAAGGGELRVGRRVRAFTASEVADAEKPPLLRAYLRRWSAEVTGYFAEDGLDRDSTDAQWRAVADHYPVFRLTPRP